MTVIVHVPVFTQGGRSCLARRPRLYSPGSRKGRRKGDSHEWHCRLRCKDLGASGRFGNGVERRSRIAREHEVGRGGIGSPLARTIGASMSAPKCSASCAVGSLFPVLHAAVPRNSASRASLRGFVNRAMGFHRRFTARGSTRLGRSPTVCSARLANWATIRVDSNA